MSPKTTPIAASVKPARGFLRRGLWSAIRPLHWRNKANAALGLAPRRVHHFVRLTSHAQSFGFPPDARELIRLEYALSVKPESNDQVQGRQYPPLVLCDNLSERRGRDPPNRRNERPRTRLP